MEPVYLDSNLSSVGVATLGNVLISLCLSILIWRVGIILVLPQDCWEELIYAGEALRTCLVLLTFMNIGCMAPFYDLRFLVVSSAFSWAFCLPLCPLALHKDLH